MATAKRTPTQAPEGELPTTAIELEPLGWSSMEIPIIGTTPLIPHRWSEKAKRQMLDSQQGKAKPKKEPKIPEEEAHAATYWLADGRPGMPATAFKAASADAARYFDKRVSIELLKRVLRVEGDGSEQLVPIEGDMTMREDTPRNSGGGADLRYRNQFWPWSATLVVRYLATALTPGAVVAIVDAGGAGGVGDWRPSAQKSKTGTFGCYRVDA